MKIWLYLALVALLVSGMGLSGCRKSADVSKMTDEQTGVHYVKLLDKGNYEEVGTLAGKDPMELKTQWLQLVGRLGPMRRIGKVQTLDDNGLPYVSVIVNFKDIDIEVALYFIEGEKGKVGRFYFNPAPPPRPKGTAPKPATGSAPEPAPEPEPGTEPEPEPAPEPTTE